VSRRDPRVSGRDPRVSGRDPRWSGRDPRWSAPGKVFLAGEYGVLAGGLAVVAAVDRRAVGRFVAGAAPSTAVVAEAVAAVRAEVGVALPEGAPEIDSAALAGEGGKLGIGSSAAVAAVAVGASLDAAGVDPAGEPDRVFALAERAHRAAQGGRGSGGDVAAAVFGGVLAYARPEGGRPRVEALGGSPLEIVVFAAGAPRATVDGIRAVEGLAARDPDRHRDRMSALAAAAEAFRRGWQAANAEAVIAAARAAGDALAELGRDAELDIWTEPVRAAATLARELGGAAKPSGAGGGDVGVAFLADRRAAEDFRAGAGPLGLRILSITTAARGLHRGP
jgi:phosphomevalonate kinase